MIKVCGNCKEDYIEGDRYCRFCGAPLGSPEYIQDSVACIYGPCPEKRTHTCNKCGFTWETYEMVDKQNWCPNCGGEAPAKEKKREIPSHLQSIRLFEKERKNKKDEDEWM